MWWLRFKDAPNADIIAVSRINCVAYVTALTSNNQAIADKLYSVVPTSVADERTASVITWINSPKRARMHISTIFAQAQIRQWRQSDIQVS